MLRAYLVDPSKPPPPRDVPVSCDIVAEGGAFFLFSYDSTGECIGDTWHASVAEAKEAARAQFGVGEEDWAEVADE